MEDEVPVGKSDDKKASLIETVFPTNANIVFGSALGTGFGMVISSIGIHFLRPGLQIQSNLIMCVGLALIVAAFGSQATVRIGRFVVAGAAAIAVFLFLMVEKRADDVTAAKIAELRSSYITGNIRKADPNSFRSMTMESDIKFLGNLYPSGDVFQFALFNTLPETRTVTMFLDDGSDEDKDFAIHRSCFAKTPGKVTRLEWEMGRSPVIPQGETEAPLALIESGTGDVIAANGDVSQSKECNYRKAQITKPSLLASLFGTAKAFAASFRNRAPTNSELMQALRDLKSGNKAVRRTARNALSLAPSGFVPNLLRTMRSVNENSPDYYRIVLGGHVALALMLRRNPGLASEIKRHYSRGDFSLLRQSARSSDRTMRNYASELMGYLRAG